MATKMKHTRAPWKMNYVPGEFEGCDASDAGVRTGDQCDAAGERRGGRRRTACGHGSLCLKLTTGLILRMRADTAQVPIEAPVAMS